MILKIMCAYAAGVVTLPAGFVIYIAIDWFRTDRESKKVKGSYVKGPLR